MPDFITAEEEAELLRFIRGLEFGTFEIRGVQARRRVADFGWSY